MTITDLYSTRIQNSFDEDQAEIVSILKAHPKKPLKLINYYKGLPLSYAATIAALDRGTLDLDVQAEQALAIEASRSVFIRSPLFRHDLFAHAQYVNVKKGAATFVKFCYVEIMAERRNFLRVIPEPNPNAVIESPLGSVEGNVYDLSLSGVNITIPHSCPLEPDAEVQIRFMLHTTDQCQGFSASVPAKLIAISGDVLPRNYRFSICPEKALERQLSHYIIQRQIEIIREIKDRVD